MAVALEGDAGGRRWSLLVAWLALLAAALVWGAANVELDLETRAAAALATAGIEGDVAVEGRDVTLAVPDAARGEAIEVVGALTGVRTVEAVAVPTEVPSPVVAPTTVATSVAPPAVRLRSAPPAPPVLARDPVAAYVSARLDEGALTLVGVVPTEAAAARIAAVAELIYAPFVTNEIRVDTTVPAPEWVEHIADAIAVLPVVGRADLRVEDRTAVVTGTARSGELADRLAGAVQGALGTSVVVAPRITISGLDAPRFEARTTADGGVEATGTVPTREIAAAITGTLAPRYGERLVVDALIIDDGVEATFSLYRLPIALQLFVPFEAWEVVIDGDAISGWLRGGASFAVGSSLLTPELESLLDIGAGILLRNPALAMVIEGHTDSIGSEESNQRLSERRAVAAVEYLVAAGVAPQRLTAIGYGETEPIGDNSTSEGRAKNRRVEFSLVPTTTGGP